MRRYKVRKIQKILFFIIILLTAIIFLGTGIALLKKNNKKSISTKTESLTSMRGNKNLYTGLGRLRAVTNNASPSTVIIFPVLEYNSTDRPFEEELLQKKEEMRQLILDWFSKHKSHAIYSMPENEIKKALLASINSILNLSKIKRIYFKEFVILE